MDARPEFSIRPPSGHRLAAINYCTPSLPLGDGVSGSMLFVVRKDVDFHAAVIAAVERFRAEAHRVDSSGRPDRLNWGDLVEVLPSPEWDALGIWPVAVPLSASIQVDHDEILADLREDV